MVNIANNSLNRCDNVCPCRFLMPFLFLLFSVNIMVLTDQNHGNEYINNLGVLTYPYDVKALWEC